MVVNSGSFHSSADDRFSFASTIIVSLLLMTVNVNENLTSTSDRMAVIHQFYLGMLVSVMASMFLCSLPVEQRRTKAGKKFGYFYVAAGCGTILLHFLLSAFCFAKWYRVI